MAINLCQEPGNSELREQRTGLHMYQLNKPQKNEYPLLLELWESSVKATHHFLQPGDINVFKSFIRDKEVFDQVNLLCARDANNTILGFMGTSGNSLEMLFISAASLRRGIGQLLLQHAIHKLGITRVDVNEQNKQAIRFYERFGFKTISRSELDGTGKPYPILHMELNATGNSL